MKLNMELDFVNRSTNGRKCSVIARSLGGGGFAYFEGTPATFAREGAREEISYGSRAAEFEDVIRAGIAHRRSRRRGR